MGCPSCVSNSNMSLENRIHVWPSALNKSPQLCNIADLFEYQNVLPIVTVYS